ncbi:hypothetical protein PRK78_004593 [Emydomyces testavorans]|uniref:Macro domain-containing protein n=1 Tax=Emydomyces testavorans TaxID=2070801 RepID=A0AAF0DI16_9EURO|nr:hypothetical protein PRK78_004593 [Emydomyces testavorans]
MASLIPLTEIPTISLLYRLKHLTPAVSPHISTPSQILNDTIGHITSDITKLEVDCIVNAANRSLLGGGGVDGAIHRAAGPGLLRECHSLGGCQTGDSKITNAYRLPCKKVIHTVGPVYWTETQHGEDQPEKLLRNCYRRSLGLAVENGMKTIAFSSISTGVYGYPSMEAADVAIQTVREFLEACPQALERVIFCTFEKKDELAYRMLIPLYFPPTPFDTPQSPAKEHTPTAPDNPVSQSPDLLAAKLPDAPTSDPLAQGEPNVKKPKLASRTADNRNPDREEEKSEDDWEKIEQPERIITPAEKLDDDPVEVDKAPTAADVQSVVSSVADLESSTEVK